MPNDHGTRKKGRGAMSNASSRFDSTSFELDGDFLDQQEDEGPRERTRYLPDTSKSVVTRNSSPDIPFDVSLNPYRGCEHGCSYCLAGDTQVLMADGSRRPISMLRPGDDIYGTVQQGHDRRLVTTQVLDQWSSSRRAYRVVLAGGTELIASRDHRFLTVQGWKHVASDHAGPPARPRLTPDDRLLGIDQRPVEGQAVVNSALLSVVEVEDLATDLTMYDITTGTGDFIANGVVSHNCYARPTHEYLGYSAGLDFERIILVKEDAPRLLEKELRKPSWEPKVLAISGITDPYQPIERKLGITRACLEVALRFRQPVAIITKNHLVTRDIDILKELAEFDAVHVTLSVTTLNEELRRRMEPRTATGQRRLDAIRELTKAGIPVSVNVAPVIPGLNDEEIPAILEAAAEAGARGASFILVRLPGAVQPVFTEWLEEHYPDRKEKVLGRLSQARNGRLDENRFGMRMRGEGAYFESIRTLFHVHRKRLGLAQRHFSVTGEHFRVPGSSSQPGLF